MKGICDICGGATSYAMIGRSHLCYGHKEGERLLSSQDEWRSKRERLYSDMVKSNYGTQEVAAWNEYTKGDHVADLHQLDSDCDVARMNIELREEPADNVRLKQSGEKQTFETGAQRDTQANKGRYDLLQPRAIHIVSRVLEEGAKHYGDRNWEKGMPVSRFLCSALRHMFQVLSGRTDEDHLGAAAWNILSALETRERIKEGLLPKELQDI